MEKNNFKNRYDGKFSFSRPDYFNYGNSRNTAALPNLRLSTKFFKNKGNSDLSSGLRSQGNIATKREETGETENENTGRHKWKNLIDFCEKSSFQGLQYFTENDRPLHERFLWAVGILLSIVSCGLLVHEMWSKWVSSPVLVAMDERMRPVWEIPFPSVTICPLARVDQNKFNLGQRFDRYHEEEHFVFNANDSSALLMCDLLYVCIWPDRMCPRSETSVLIQHLEDYAIRIEEIVYNSTFNSERINHSIEFQPLLTRKGICYSFNMLPAKYIFRKDTFHASRKYLNYNKTVEWDVDNGYSSRKLSPYPRRGVGSGLPAGLHIHLTTNSIHFADYCTQTMQGFEVSLHSPEHLPQVEQTSFIIPLGYTTNVAIKPYEVLTAPELKSSYSSKDRQCYYSNERYLRFFNFYTQENCEFECLSNITFAHCRCVNHDMPRVSTTRVCGEDTDYCVFRARRLFQIIESNLDFTEDDKKIHLNESMIIGLEPCNCMQSCSHLSFEAERSQGELNFQKYLTKFGKLNVPNGMMHSFLNIFYKESQFIPTRRMELYGTTTFLANCGGVLGLCLGMSVLSFVEIFYWLIVRPLEKFTKRSKQTSQQNDEWEQRHRIFVTSDMYRKLPL